VGNFQCAPIDPAEGFFIVRQVNVNEKASKIGTSYKAWILDDRYVHDNCNWTMGGEVIDFKNKESVLSEFLFSSKELSKAAIYKIVCIPLNDHKGGICTTEDNLTPIEQKTPNKFEAEVEVVR
jgi:hypothetical protein